MTLEEMFKVGFAYGNRYGYYNGGPPERLMSSREINSFKRGAKEIWVKLKKSDLLYKVETD